MLPRAGEGHGQSGSDVEPRKPAGFRVLLLLGLALICVSAGTAQTKIMNGSTNHTEIATLGGGCFWCTEAIFQMLPGVKSVTSGYAGGTKENPTYKDVCTGNTGHAEVIQIEYDPTKVSYDKLLETFWEAHDPTTMNRQGHDSGTQYRSIILYSSEAQKAAAEKSKAAAQKQLGKPIVTEIVPLTKFYKAEGYHQDYYRDNPDQAYCRAVIRPKVEKFEKKLKEAAH
jgi:peptide-methionine (S)-S-oxide reductase